MSATLSYEQQQLPAGLLALAVHGVFFALLYFSFSWQSQAVRTMSVDLWQSLPVHQPEIVPRAVPKRTQRPKSTPKPMRPPQPAQPEKLIKPDIVLPEKKIPKKVIVKPVVSKADLKKSAEQKEAKRLAEEKILLEERKRVEQAALELAEEEQALLAEREMVEQVAREQAAQNAAINAVVNEYIAKITAKIRRNIVIPPDVPDDALAKFSVTLLPGGAVLSARLKKTSGDADYDNAVERAILKSQPLPLPPDVALFKKFRNLILTFKPVE